MAQKKSSSAGKIVLLIVVAVLFAGLGYFIYVYFQVHHVTSEGNAMYTSPYIAALANVPEGTHMFEVDSDAIISRIESAEPYLEVTGISRKYPDTLVIAVRERRPMALLPYANQYLLTDGQGTALETVNDPELVEMPVVEGIGVTGVEIGSPVSTEDEFKIAVMQEILQELNTRDLFELIMTVDLSNINNIQLVSKNGLRIRFGQAEKTSDKVKWIANRLPALEREGQVDGILDVSSGSFATYTKMDGGRPSSSPTEDDGESSGDAEQGTDGEGDKQDTSGSRDEAGSDDESSRARESSGDESD